MLQRGLDCGQKHHCDDAQWKIKPCEMYLHVRYLVVRYVTPALQLQRVPAPKVNGTRCCEAAWGRIERAGLTGRFPGLMPSVDGGQMLLHHLMSAVSVNACTALLLVKMCPSAGPRGSTGGSSFQPYLSTEVLMQEPNGAQR